MSQPDEETLLAERYRLSTESVAAAVQLHMNHCKICRCTFRKCDEGQHWIKLLAIVQVSRMHSIFKPLDVS